MPSVLSLKGLDPIWIPTYFPLPLDVKNILCHEYFNLILLTNGYAFEEMEIWGFFLPLNFVVVVKASEDCARSFRGLQPPLILLIQSAHAH